MDNYIVNILPSPNNPPNAHTAHTHQRGMAVHYQPGAANGASPGIKMSLMLTTRALMGEVAKYGHFVVTDGKNDTNSAGYILSCFSLRTRHGIPYSAFCWIGEEETEGTIFSAGQVFSNLVPCADSGCSHPWITKLRPDGGFTVCCQCSVKSAFRPASSTDKFVGSVNALNRLGWHPVSLCDFHAFQAIDRQLRITVRVPRIDTPSITLMSYCARIVPIHPSARQQGLNKAHCAMVLTGMRLLKRCRTDSQVTFLRTQLLDLLISNAAQLGSESRLSYKEVGSIMDYIDTYWLNNQTILNAFIDGPSLNVKAYETTDNIVEGMWKWFDGQ